MKKTFAILASLLLFAAGAMAQSAKASTSIAAVDTIDITMDNALRNDIVDFRDYYGYYVIRGCDSSYTYQMSIAVKSDQIAGSYTNDDVIPDEDILLFNMRSITINEVRDFTVEGNIDTCSTYIEMISADSVLYRITYINPGVYRPVVPTDTVDIITDNSKSRLFDGTATYGFFQMHCYDKDFEYSIHIGVKSDQVAGSYTYRDILELYTMFYICSGGDSTLINLSDVRDFTVTGDASACSTHIELVSIDSVLYRINFFYDKTTTVVENTTATEQFVYNEGNVIVVNGSEGKEMTVYDIEGKEIARKKADSDVERIEIGVPGVYVVCIGDRSSKVLIR